MTHPRWSEVRTILEEALELGALDRATFIDDRCGADQELAQELQRLLALEHGAGDSKRARWLDDGLFAGTDAEQFLDPHGSEGGGSVGPYRIRRLIGAGGMGQVYEAIQDSPQRVVALKVMTVGPHTKSELQRFEQEAHFLARLRHPGIAQIYEYSTHEMQSGAKRPFFVMEFVEGARTITQFASEEALDRTATLELFAQVCEAVHFGHLKGVLHRDLKPGNILVDGEGRPKVIDFGVARITDPDSSIASDLTQTGQIVGTLRYMSPEQVQSSPDELDMRSDVYALGVVLYELLCGSAPYTFESDNLPAIALAIVEQQPRRPSSLNSGLRGDLEWILLRALEKEPTRRYQSASDLALDLRRHLNHQPVTASPPSKLYLMRKFGRRHRAAVVLSALLLLSMGGGGYVAIREYLGRREAMLARNALLEDQREARLREAEIQDVLKSAVETIALHPGQDDPETHALLQSVGEKLPEIYAGKPLREGSLRRQLAQALYKMGRYRESELEIRQALELFEKEVGSESALVIDTSMQLAYSLNAQAEHAEALELFEECLERVVMLPEPRPSLVASVHVELARELMLYPGRAAEVESLIRAALGPLRDAHGAQGKDVLLAEGILARAIFEQGRQEEALDLLASVRQRASALRGSTNQTTESLTLTQADLYSRMKRFDEAADLIRVIHDDLTSVLGAHHPRTLYAAGALSQYLIHSDHLEEAERILEDAWSGAEKVLGALHTTTLVLRDSYGGAIQLQGRWEEAEPHRRAAVEGLRSTQGDSHPSTLACMEGLADLYRRQGHLDEAIEIFELYLAGTIVADGLGGSRTLRARIELLEQYLEVEKFEGARDQAEIALGVLQDDPDADEVLYGLAQLYLGKSLVGLGRTGEALGPLKAARGLLGRLLGVEDPLTQDAESCLRSALEVR